MPEVVEAQVGPFSGLPGLSEVIGCLPLLIRGLLVRVQSGEPVDECVSACQMTEGPWRTTTLRGPSVVPLGSLTQRNRVGLSEPLLLRSHGPAIEQQLAKSSGLKPGEVAVITYVALHQPATIPDVASGVGYGYRWAQDFLAVLRRSGLVVRWQSGPARSPSPTPVRTCPFRSAGANCWVRSPSVRVLRRWPCLGQRLRAGSAWLRPVSNARAEP